MEIDIKMLKHFMRKKLLSGNCSKIVSMNSQFIEINEIKSACVSVFFLQLSTVESQKMHARGALKFSHHIYKERFKVGIK